MRGLLTSFLLLLSTCAIQVSSGSLSVYGNALGLIPPGGFFLGDKSYAAVIDEEAQFAYYGNFLSTWLFKVDLATMLVVDQLQLQNNPPPTPDNTSVAIYNAVIDNVNAKAYFSTLDVPANIYKIDLATFTVEATLTNVPGGLYALCIDIPNQLLYAGNMYDVTNDIFGTGSITKIDLVTFTVVAQIHSNPGETLLRTCVIDSENQLAWFGGVATPFILQVDLTTFQINNRKTFVTGGGGYYSAGMYQANKDLYFGVQKMGTGVVLRTNKDFTINQLITLGPDSAFQQAVAIDQIHGIAYFGSTTGFVTPIDLNTNQPLAALKLPLGSSLIFNMLIDQQQGLLYASSQRKPAPIGADETLVYKITINQVAADPTLPPTLAPTSAPTTKKQGKKAAKAAKKQTRKNNRQKKKKGNKNH